MGKSCCLYSISKKLLSFAFLVNDVMIGGDFAFFMTSSPIQGAHFVAQTFIGL